MVLKKKKPIKFFFMMQSVLLPDYRRSLKEEGRKVLSLNKKWNIDYCMDLDIYNFFKC